MHRRIDRNFKYILEEVTANGDRGLDASLKSIYAETAATRKTVDGLVRTVDGLVRLLEPEARRMRATTAVKDWAVNSSAVKALRGRFVRTIFYAGLVYVLAATLQAYTGVELSSLIKLLGK